MTAVTEAAAPTAPARSTRAAVERVAVVAAPLGLIATGALHVVSYTPPDADPVAAIGSRSGLWIGIHVAQLVLVALLAVAVHALSRGLSGRWPVVARCALVPFLVFYSAFDAIVGIGTGVLVRLAASGGPAEAALVEAFWDGRLGGVTVAIIAIGSASWLVAMGATTMALRGAGASRSVVVAFALATLLFAIDHAFPTGPAAMTAFLVGAVLYTRRGDIGRSSGV